MLKKDARIELLRKVSLFETLSKAELRQLATVADEIDLPEGKVLMREGDTGREFFVLVDGTVRVSRNGRKVIDLGPGDWVGEIALLTSSPRTATVVATAPVHALVIVDRQFRALVKQTPDIAVRVLGCVAVRLSRDPRA
jgi:CRP/FNR family cyclic AMP-dependent transcriptional regulator